MGTSQSDSWNRGLVQFWRAIVVVCPTLSIHESTVPRLPECDCRSPTTNMKPFGYFRRMGSQRAECYEKLDY